MTGSEDNTARVWDLSGAPPVTTPLEGHGDAVISVGFSCIFCVQRPLGCQGLPSDGGVS